MPNLIEYLRHQAWAANRMADALENGESVEDLKWQTDLFTLEELDTELAAFYVEMTGKVTAA